MILSMRYSIDSRRIVVKALDAGQSIQQVAKRLRSAIRPSAIIKNWLDETCLNHANVGPKKTTKITPEDEQIIRRLLAEQPGITLKGLIKHISTAGRRIDYKPPAQTFGNHVKKDTDAA